MPKLKKLSPDEARKQFHEPFEKRKKTQMVAAEIAFQNETKKALAEIRKTEKSKYVNAYRNDAIVEVRRKRLAKCLRDWLKTYLESRYSVRDFEKWRKSKPNEALPWAWKVTYGDEAGAPAARGQVNVLIQLLTGHAPQGMGVSETQLLSTTTPSPKIEGRDGQILGPTGDVQTETGKSEIPPGTPTL